MSKSVGVIYKQRYVKASLVACSQTLRGSFGTPDGISRYIRWVRLAHGTILSYLSYVIVIPLL